MIVYIIPAAFLVLFIALEWEGRWAERRAKPKD
jgi:hypothetical protein